MAYRIDGACAGLRKGGAGISFVDDHSNGDSEASNFRSGHRAAEDAPGCRTFFRGIDYAAAQLLFSIVLSEAAMISTASSIDEMVSTRVSRVHSNT